MSEYGYKLREYEDVTKKMTETIKEVTKFVKDDKVCARDIKDKFGDKVEMAAIIIRFSNVCLEAKKLLEKSHSHNFDLRGKVAECSTDAMKNLSEDFKGMQREMVSDIEDLKKRLDKPKVEEINSE